MVVGTFVFGAKMSNQRTQWTQYALDAVCSGIVVYGGGDIVFGAKRSKQWTQYAVDAVCSGIVVYGGEDIVFGAKTSNLWIQYAGTQWNSGIWWWGHLSLVQKCQTRGCSGHSMH